MHTHVFMAHSQALLRANMCAKVQEETGRAGAHLCCATRRLRGQEVAARGGMHKSPRGCCSSICAQQAQAAASVGHVPRRSSAPS